MSQVPQEPSLTPGTKFGRYRIDGPIGAGGMGAVYRAYDTTLKRPLAIKVLRYGSGPGGTDDQLLREAQSASALSHSAICTVYEVGAEHGATFIAMEFVDGTALSAKVAEGPLDTDQVVRYGIDVADALAHAHERGVIHRDLKAANIIVSKSGRLKIVDFGLARRLDTPMTEAPTMASVSGSGLTGTPYAMSPEQVKGVRADPRADIWALGVLLYEMQSGRQPFTGATIAELMAAILRDPPAPLPLTPEPIRHVIETCLAKDPAKRYQSAEDVKLALENILSGARGRDSGVHTGAMEATPPPPMLARTLPDVTFVGRERELGILSDAWARAKDGHRQLAVVAGEPGIGKTRLSLEFARRCADEPATVLVGRCDEEALVPYQPFVEALGWYARMAPEPALRATVPASGGAELGLFVPDFLIRLPDLPAPAPMNAQGQRYRLFESVSALLASISRLRPVLVLLDDLHWADKPTLSLLRHVIRGSEPAALLMLGTYREGEVAVAGHPLAEMLADLRRESAVARVSLAGLERRDIDTLVGTFATTGVSPGLSSRVAESSGGNPFFVGEILRHLNETGAMAGEADARATLSATPGGLPEGIREVILRRVSRLSDASSRTLSLAAVLGREFDLDVLEAVGDLSEDALLDAIDEARRAQLVDEAAGRPGRFTFHHALIKDALYDGLAASRRVRMHRRAAEAIERLTARASDPPLADLAYHFVQAGVADKAAEYATRAGDRMASALAQEEASRFYDLALKALDQLVAGSDVERQRVGLQRRRGLNFGNLGQWANQRPALEQALRHLQPDQIEERCEILADLAQTHFWLFDIPSLEKVSTEVLDLADRLGRTDLAANARGWLARCRQAGGKVIEAMDMDRETIDRFGSEAHVAHSLGSAVLYWAGRGSAGVSMAAKAAEMAGVSRDATFTMYSQSHYAINLAAVGRYAEAARVFDESRAFGRKYGTMPMLARVISMSAGYRFSLGDLEGAEERQQEARERARSVNFSPSIVSPSIDLLLIAARRGEPGGVETLFNETVEMSLKNPGWHGWLWKLRLCQVRAELALARGEWESAIAASTEGIAQCQLVTRPKYEALGLVTRAQARRQLGHPSEGAADARQAVEIARATEDPALLLWTLDALLQIDGDDATAREAKATSGKIVEALVADDALRRRFLESEMASRIAKL